MLYLEFDNNYRHTQPEFSLNLHPGAIAVSGDTLSHSIGVIYSISMQGLKMSYMMSLIFN